MKKLRKYLTSVIIGLLIALLVLQSKNTFSHKEIILIYQDLSDAFFVSGILILLFGLMVVVTNEHVFDIAVYGSKVLFNSVMRRGNRKIANSYIEYRLLQDEKGKASYFYSIIVGLLFIAISIIFLLLFNSEYTGLESGL